MTDDATANVALDPPSEFDAMPLLAQQALRMWIRLALQPAPGYQSSNWYQASPGVWHNGQNALGWPASNGQAKGAMLARRL